MANFNGFKLTKQGLDLEYKVQLGQTLKITRFGLGDGDLNNTPISELTSLKHEVISREIIKSRKDKSKITLGFVIDNKEIEEGFYLREIGIFAEDPDSKQEILFMYATAADTADFIPAKTSSNVLEKYIDVDIYISDAEKVEAIIDTSLIYATYKDLEGKVDKEEGKMLSSNDFSNEAKNKLDNLNNYDDTNLKNAINDKADKTAVTALETKVNAKADTTYVNTQIATKADKKKTWNVVIDTNWAGTGPYTKTIAVQGITANDIPKLYPIWSEDLATRTTEKEEYNKISVIKSSANAIELTCDEEATTVALNARIEVSY